MRSVNSRICLGLFRIWTASLATVVSMVPLGAQDPIITTSIASGTTTAIGAMGSPAGSYVLSGIDTVNLFNGSLNVSVPLLKIGGRGEAGYTMAVPIMERWLMWTTFDPITGQYSYTQMSTRGDIDPYSPGALIVNSDYGNDYQQCNLNVDPPQYFPINTLTRLSFTLPDGTSTDMVDQLTGGATLGYSCSQQGASRGTVFVARDGSGTTFVADAPVHDAIMWGLIASPGPGTLIFRNGLRYRFEDGVVWIRDRNGNQISFQHDSYGQVSTILDSLQRVITITRSAAADQITFLGAGGASRTITVNRDSNTCLAPGYSAETGTQLFGTYGSGATFIPCGPVSIVLPDGRAYKFLYNSYGEVAQITLPTGGIRVYTYGPDGADCIVGYPGAPDLFVHRRVLTRDVYPDGQTLEQHTVYEVDFKSATVYAGYSGTMNYPFTRVKVHHYDGQGFSMGTQPWFASPPTSAPLSHEAHYFYGDESGGFLTPINYAFWLDGKEYQTDELAADGTTVLRSRIQAWHQRLCGASEHCVGGEIVSNINTPGVNSDGELSPTDPRVTQLQTVLDTNQTSQELYFYDQHNNRTDLYQYDYGNAAPGPLLRHTQTSYVTDCDASNPPNCYDTLTGTHLLSLVKEVIVFDQTGVKVADTQYCYDAQSGGNCRSPAGLTGRSNLSGFTDPGTPMRGNLTTTARWLNTDNSYIQTSAAYDVAGNVVRTTDANGNQTQLDYDSNSNTYAFLSRLTDALGHSTTLTWDLDIGKPTTITDPNNQPTSADYTDPLDRLKSVTYPDGGTTAYDYNDATNTVTDTKTINSSQILSQNYIYDGLGRLTQTQITSDPEGTDYIDTTYDAGGRVYSVSNPHRSAASSTDGTTYHYYDALGRITQVTQPDTSTILTTYTGRATQVQDEGNGTQRVTRISQVDGLGRLASLCEVAPGPFVGPAGASSSSLIGSAGTPAACALDIGGTGFLTTYQYDALDNLLQVNQSGIAPRTFTYDSLSRLLSASNPESGATSYTYDADGNVHTKTDARNITTTYSYDALNRPTGKTYSDGTPAATFNYDQTSALGVTLANTIGRKSSESTAGSLQTGSVFSYDKMGRVADNSQCTPQNCGTGVFTIQYTQYDLLGNLTAVQFSGLTAGCGLRRRCL
jgi:YD repeat-containing protein